jgi:integrase/recombinase XerD
LKSFFGWLELEEYIPKDPTRKLKAYKLPKRLRKSLTVEELEMLRDSCKTLRERSILEWIFSTGCRLSEVINTDIDDLNFKDYSVRVIGKGNKEREVYFSPKAKLYLDKYLASRKDSCPALFVTLRKPIHRLGARGIQKEVDKIAVKAGFDKAVFPHLLRHTMATLGVQSGAKLTTIQHLLGHDDPSTTQIYAETSLEEVRLEYKQHLIQ